MGLAFTDTKINSPDNEELGITDISPNIDTGRAPFQTTNDDVYSKVNNSGNVVNKNVKDVFTATVNGFTITSQQIGDSIVTTVDGVNSHTTTTVAKLNPTFQWVYSSASQTNAPFQGTANTSNVINFTGSGTLHGIQVVGGDYSGGTYYAKQLFIEIIIDGNQYYLEGERSSGPNGSTQILTNGIASFVEAQAPGGLTYDYTKWGGEPLFGIVPYDTSATRRSNLTSNINVVFKNSLIIRHYVYPGSEGVGGNNSSATQKIGVLWSKNV